MSQFKQIWGNSVENPSSKLKKLKLRLEHNLF